MHTSIITASIFTQKNKPELIYLYILLLSFKNISWYIIQIHRCNRLRFTRVIQNNFQKILFSSQFQKFEFDGEEFVGKLKNTHVSFIYQ